MQEKRRRYIWSFLLLILLMGVFFGAFSAAAAEKNGWVTLSNGKIRYYNNGKYYKNFHMIDGKRYYFRPENGYLKTSGFTKGTKDSSKRYYSSPTGELYTSVLKKIKGSYYYFKSNATAARSEWITLNGKQYYFNANYKAAVGIRKISGTYRVFSDQGVLCQKRGKYIQGEKIYFLNAYSQLVFAKVDGQYYNERNQAVGDERAKCYEAFLFAYDRVQAITNASMSASEKLRICFDDVTGASYKIMRTDLYYDGWDADFANDIFMLRKGDCVSNACAVAYMFKALGYRDVYYCSNRTGNVDNHSWCELDGLVYDALFAPIEDRGGYAQNYAAEYTAFGQPVALKIEILPYIDF